MLVPSSDAARYLLEFKPCASTPNFYQTADGQQYPQLLNFFQEQSPVGGTQFDQFHRILNYIGVPSWYAGTDIQANPTLASNTTAPDGSHCFHTPYNKISTYREPGKINLNTIYHQEVFNGLMNGTTSPTWSDFWRSRQGYVGGGNILDKDPTGSIPTEFLAPFRSYDAPNLSPILVPSWLTSTLPPEINEIQATLLRKSNTNPNPLFQQSPTDYGVNPGDIIDRNPYFHYKDIMRLPNLTTTRSNVYALWVTVGYFEVTPVDVSNKPWITTPAQKQQIYPDGYELGQELGSDTGEIVRHRGFYMIDRSIPVGFQRGQDMNVDKAILLKRFIE
jgi:hypothetical protein